MPVTPSACGNCAFINDTNLHVWLLEFSKKKRWNVVFSTFFCCCSSLGNLFLSNYLWLWIYFSKIITFLTLWKWVSFCHESWNVPAAAYHDIFSFSFACYINILLLLYLTNENCNYEPFKSILTPWTFSSFYNHTLVSIYISGCDAIVTR